MDNKINWFEDCQTVGDTKKAFRLFALIHHPDKGGDLENFRDLYDAYHRTLKNLDGTTNRGDDGKDHIYIYDPDLEEKLGEKLINVLNNLPNHATAYIIGLWIWVLDTQRGDGSAKILKSESFCWHRTRKAWYFAGVPCRRRSNKSIDELANTYGCKKFAKNQDDQNRKLISV